MPAAAQCPQNDLGSALPISVSGTTVGAANTMGGTCGGGSAPDATYQWTAPTAGYYAVDTFGSAYDTVLYVRDGSCTGAQLACNDDFGGLTSQVTVGVAAAQTVIIVVDGYSANSGSYNLHISMAPTPTPTSTPMPTFTPTITPTITPTFTPHTGQSVHVAFIGSAAVINGGYLPTSGPVGELGDFTFSNLAPGGVTAPNLAAFDTAVLNVASAEMNCSTATLSAGAKANLVAFVNGGGKLIIYDSECPPQDYSWLPFSFTTSNPGAMGAPGTLTIVENNDLSSNNPSDIHFINAAAMGPVDEVGDANVMTTFDPNWCLDVSATNYFNTTGPVHTYARFAAGLIIYNGLDMDEMGNEPTPPSPNGLRKLWVQELQVRFNPTFATDLPCGLTVVGITLAPASASNPAGQNHTVTATVSDLLGQPQPGVVVTFTVISGPNAGATGACTPNPNCATDSNGHTGFTYADLGGPGTDQIKACFTNQASQVVCSQIVTKEWVPPTATPTSTPTATPSETPTLTPPLTSTSTPNATPSDTPTQGATLTITMTPTHTPTETATPTPTGPCGPTDPAPVTCSEQQPCDVLGPSEVCPGGATVTEDSTAAEADADTMCSGATVRVIRSKSGEFTDSASSSSSVCGSNCYESCTHHCAIVPIQQCYQVCVRRCTNGVCLDWETRCQQSQIEHDCAVDCFDQCQASLDPLTQTSYFLHRCGFPIADTIQVRVSNGTCTGTTVSTHALSGAGTVAANLPLPLTPGTYDVCHGSTLLRTITVNDCGLPACSLMVADPHLVLTQGQDASLSVGLNSVPTGGSFNLSLHRFEDDAKTIPLNVPSFLTVPSQAVTNTSVMVSATNPQPLSGQTHWANVLLTAEGPATCSVGIDVDVTEQAPSPTQVPTETPTQMPPSPPTVTPTNPAPPAPQLSVEPPSPHDFGSVQIGLSRTFTYTAQNTGSAPLTGTVTAPCAGFSVEPSNLSLDVGQQTNVKVTFTPPSVGSFTCQLRFTTNGGTLELALSGTGAAAPAIPVVPSPLSPAGLALITGLGLSMGWTLRRRWRAAGAGKAAQSIG